MFLNLPAEAATRRFGASPLRSGSGQDLLFAYKSIYTEINSGILIRGLDPSLGYPHQVFLFTCICNLNIIFASTARYVAAELRTIISF